MSVAAVVPLSRHAWKVAHMIVLVLTGPARQRLPGFRSMACSSHTCQQVSSAEASCVLGLELNDVMCCHRHDTVFVFITDMM